MGKYMIIKRNPFNLEIKNATNKYKENKSFKVRNSNDRLFCELHQFMLIYLG